MTMDASAIAAIQQAAAIEAAAASIGYSTSSTARGAVALPSDFKIMDVETFLPTRSRMRGKMTTTSLTAFCAFVANREEDGSTVFVDPFALTATAVLNLGTPAKPGHADSIAVLDGKPTAAAVALREVTRGVPVSQTALAEFLEDWSSQISCSDKDGEKTFGNHQAVAAIRKMTIESMRKSESEVQSLGAARSAMEEVKAKSEGGQIPAFIRFTCEPCVFLPSREFTLRLSIITGDKGPTFTLRVIKLEQHQQEMGEEMASLITKCMQEMDAQSSIGIGSYSSGK